MLLAGRGQNGELVTIRAMGQTFVVRNHLPPSAPPCVAIATTSTSPNNIEQHSQLSDDDELPTVCEELSPPLSTPTSSSPTSAPVFTTASVNTCADQSDEYQDFLSKFGILNLPLHPTLDRQSVAQIDSPDDTLVSGSLSPLLDQLDSPLTPDVPPGGKCYVNRPPAPV